TIRRQVPADMIAMKVGEDHGIDVFRRNAITPHVVQEAPLNSAQELNRAGADSCVAQDGLPLRANGVTCGLRPESAVAIRVGIEGAVGLEVGLALFGKENLPGEFKGSIEERDDLDISYHDPYCPHREFPSLRAKARQLIGVSWVTVNFRRRPDEARSPARPASQAGRRG